jgi:hypothetical protein
MMRSAHSTSDTKIVGDPNFAFHSFKSASPTPRAREQTPHAKTGICLATTLSRISLSGGHPTGNIAAKVALRIRYVASPVRKICTSCPASARANPCAKTNEALVGSSEPQALFIMTLSVFGFATSSPFAAPKPSRPMPRSCPSRGKNCRRIMASFLQIPN